MDQTGSDVRGCASIGPLNDFVQRLDSSGNASSVHALAGQLYMAAGERPARLRWIRDVRDRFAAIYSACLELDLSEGHSVVVVADPPDRPAPALALEAITTAVQACAIG